ncbi:MAG: glycosyltransferase family 2 protein [Bacteroidetes bacterium]|nr:glycosyltransferase family 2 protein [Bacteroidota bacterium]MBS1649264.1 glycosyltransferase family 2 protein [Bacteroidota bacterium]
MLFSVIIPTANRNELLAKCLNCLEQSIQLLNKNEVEVIVTDDGKNNEAKEFIANNYTWVKWMEGPKKGPAANRNNGAKYAIGEWLAFLDDDCEPSKNWLSAFKNCIADFEVLEGMTIADRERKTLAEESPINTSGGQLWSCNFAIKKIRFNEIGGFDENFPYASMEDVDFRMRIAKANIKYPFIKDALVIHPWRELKNTNRFKFYFKSLQYFLSKYPEQKKQHNIPLYLYIISKRFFTETCVAVFKLDFKGAYYSLMNNLIDFYYSFKVLSWKMN